ncbi:MAG: PAS domain S-box protein [Desulfobacteraceae bacterium]|jgi:PAS domain S-box-containing protein
MEIENQLCQICSFFELAPVGYFVLDTRGSIKMVNSTGAGLLGAERHWLQNKDFFQFVFPQFEKKFLMLFRKTLDTGERWERVIRLAKHNGGFFDAKLESLAALDDRGRVSHLHLIVTDVESGRHAHADARESEANFKALEKSANDGIFIAVDKGAIVHANQRLSEITGYAVPEIVRIGIHKLIDPEERRVLSDRYRKQMAGEKVPARYETNMVHKDGRKVPIEVTVSKTAWQGKPAMLATIRDITKRKQTEEGLQESQKHFKALVESSKSGIMLAADEGKIVFANTGFAKLCGYPLSELLDTSFTKLVDPAELDRVKGIYRRRLAGVSEPTHYETIFLHKDGRQIPVYTTASLTTWKGQPAVMGIFRDVTHHKRLESELTNSRNKLEQRVQERTAKLERDQKKLELKISELEKLNQELVETNKGLSKPARRPARKSGKKKKDEQGRISNLIADKIMLLVEKLHKDRSFKKCRADLELLMAYANGLSADSSLKDSIILALSEAELQVALLVKNGLTSAQIAAQLKIPMSTVKTLRTNIRKKLNIKNPRTNLATYLKSKMS